MTPEHITSLIRETFLVAIEIATPFLLLVLVIGLLISILQSFAKVQEITLSFVPKMLVLAAALTIFFPWILKIMTKFTHSILITHWDKVVQHALF